MMNLIFDLGANVGGNIEYYLSKAQKVVAVEATPNLCKGMEEKFEKHIKSGKLVIVNSCLTIEERANEVDFYVHKYESGLSRFTRPKVSPLDFDKISVPSISYFQLIQQYGTPDFVKIDLEGYDRFILDYMMKENLLPSYLQFENQGLLTLEKLISLNKYVSFNIVPFYNFTKFYNTSNDRNAGPFGDDIKSPWLSSPNIVNVYKNLNHSWVDIHLSAENYTLQDKIDLSFYHYREPFINKIKRGIPDRLKSKIKILINYRRN